MKFILPEKAVNKAGLFLSIFLISFAAVSQNQPADSQYVRQLSESILQKKLDFQWNGGSLSAALNKIGSEHKIKFSFSNSRIEDVQTSSISYYQIKLFDLLNLLFKNTGFNYVLVGRLIAVYKDETNINIPNVPADSSLAVTDTIYKKKPSPVYSPSSTGYLSEYERKLLNKIYKEELQWAAHHRKEQQKSNSDSIDTESRKDYTIRKRKDYRYFILLSGGYPTNQIKWKDNTRLPWREDLKWDSKWENNFYPELQVGVQVKNFLFSTGIGFQKFSIENSFTETIRKGPPNFPPPPVFEYIPHTVREEYRMVSIPISVIYHRQWKNWWLGIGGGAKLNFVSGNKVMSKRFEKYYTDTLGVGSYSENYNSLIPSLLADATVGYIFGGKFTLAGGISYNYSLAPVYENSLYSLTINSLVYRMGGYYRFNIYSRKK